VRFANEGVKPEFQLEPKSNFQTKFMNLSKIIKLLAFMALAGLLAGCVGPNGQPNYTGSSALIGGASGAAIGAAADRRNPGAGALIGGAAGLIAGGLIGNSMDQQAAAQRATQPPPTVVVAPQSQPMSIADIKAMAKSGISDDIIINQIMNTHSVYNLDANDIIDLKTAGVSDKVMTYMMNTSASVVATQAPPPPPTEVQAAPPGPDYMWVDGDWTWNGVGWVWIGGRWILPPYSHAIWVGPGWERGSGGWHRVPGHWR
jgi:hypothetical protein